MNIEAAVLMGKLHDQLKEIGYVGHELEIYLVRLLFCLFAEDTGIFNKNIFYEYILNKTNEDGSDLGAHLSQIFYILNVPKDKRLKNIDESLNEFPFVNGKLFNETIAPAAFNSKMRKALLDCCMLDWGKISPAIFGALFQSVMNIEIRRNLGAHYTSEKNILKLIKPLFLDKLWDEFHKIKNNIKKLEEFHNKIAKIKLLDPACGCGNFLIIAYRELRLLEIEIIKELNKHQAMSLDISNLILLNVDQMYGIEIEEFPSKVAEVAMWLMDHQMNMLVSENFGMYFVRIPLQKSANITFTNALRVDWHDLIQPEQIITHIFKDGEQKATLEELSKGDFDYILGNPPFVGKQYQKDWQKKDIEDIFMGVNGTGILDYVTCWYLKAAKYIQLKKTKVAFVSTNSISQGEQVGILWNELFGKYNIKIHFAHKTFKWTNEAKGQAAVYVVIISFANYDIDEKYIYEYETIKSEPHEVKANNINPYLVEGNDLVILKRREPLCDVPKIIFGNMPNDGGHFLFTEEERINFLNIEPNANKFFKEFLSAREFINGVKRWCLWLEDISPSELKGLPEIIKRVELVKKVRKSSSRETTKKLAEYPTLFGEIRQPKSDYILIPRVSSENRKYIPMNIFSKDYIVGDSCLCIPDVNLYHLGVLTSFMHMTWVNFVCGRLKSDFRYSNEIVYNNFPWPMNPTEKHIKSIEVASQGVLDIRKDFLNSSLAELYNPISMPPRLVKAHQTLDKEVDKCYRSQPFQNETKRMEFLFELYEVYNKPLIGKKGKEKPKTKRHTTERVSGTEE
ncbi:MAG: class I SAM-dependent DNA methyltransferase [Leptospiraceae bacterium]|nr:class I SAM-dependent DNA methyltransferase [Leptospiraceae bacterium]